MLLDCINKKKEKFKEFDKFINNLANKNGTTEY